MTIEEKLHYLRKVWTKFPEKRFAVELQARCLQAALRAEEQRWSLGGMSDEEILTALDPNIQPVQQAIDF